MRTTFVTVMVKGYSGGNLITAMFKVLYQQLRGTLATAFFKRHPIIENLSVPQKSEPVLQRTQHQNR